MAEGRASVGPDVSTHGRPAVLGAGGAEMGEPMRGLGVSPGVVLAPVAWLGEPVRPPADEPPARDVEVALQEVRAALDAVASDLAARAGAASGAAKDVLSATAAIARDPALVDSVRTRLEGGAGPGRALDEAFGGFASLLAAAGGYLAERVSDLYDVRDRALAVLLGVPMPGVPETDGPVVLVASDLSPADTAGLDPTRIVGLVTSGGGPTSHTAILAKSLGIPAVVACPDAWRLNEGEIVLLDGGTGLVTRQPDKAAATRAAQRASIWRGLVTTTSGPGRSADGHPVRLLVNLATMTDIEHAVALDCEGVGLFRTEFLFLDRPDAPTEEEQQRTYTRLLRAFTDRSVTVRTLDAGADKPLPFLAHGDEPNPALGMRGLRLARRHPDLLDTQLAALARAATTGPTRLRVMAPMVATAEEARDFIDRARAHGLDEAGVMVEIPAAALRAEQICAEVDFLSIGTNDLSQYTFAADRMTGELAGLLDPWQPALLDLIAAVGLAGGRSGTPVGVCGEAAGDPLLACALVGLGVTSLSMAPGVLPIVRAALSRHELATCQAMAIAARAASTPTAARAAALELAHPDLVAALQA